MAIIVDKPQQQVSLQDRANSLKKLMEASKKEILAALPKHIDPDRMLRIAMTEARKIPKLLECDQASFLGAVIQASQLGLEPGGALGHCYLIPFWNNKTKLNEVQFMMGYRGMVDLAYRSERVSHVAARLVYEDEPFSAKFGTEEFIDHTPIFNAKPGRKIIAVYCVIFLKSGGKLFDVMTMDEVDEIRKSSKAGDSGPWNTHYNEMAKKSVVRRLFKMSPVSIEVQKSVGLDELADAGESQGLGAIFETTGRPVESQLSKAEQLQAKLQGEMGSATSSEFENAVAATADPRDLIK